MTGKIAIASLSNAFPRPDEANPVFHLRHAETALSQNGEGAARHGPQAIATSQQVCKDYRPHTRARRQGTRTVLEETLFSPPQRLS